ncbi:MAG: hypothetical protein WBO17_00240, partial [Sphingorhabdus sp.]
GRSRSCAGILEGLIPLDCLALRNCRTTQAQRYKDLERKRGRFGGPFFVFIDADLGRLTKRSRQFGKMPFAVTTQLSEN